MKRLVIGDKDLSNLTLGGIVVNKDTKKGSFYIDKLGIKYFLFFVEDKIIILRKTLKTVNYDIYNHLGEVVEDGYIVTEEMSRFYDSLQVDEAPEVITEPEVVETTVKKFSELDIDGMDKSKRVNISQLEITGVLLAENDDFSYVLFVDKDNNHYVPVEDTTQPAGYSALKIEEEFVFDCGVSGSGLSGIVCDLGKNYLKDLEGKVFINDLPLTFNKNKFDFIYRYKFENKTVQVFKKDHNEHKVTKIDLRGTIIYTYELTTEMDFTRYETLYKAYKSTKKNNGITSEKYDKMLGLFKY